MTAIFYRKTTFLRSIHIHPRTLIRARIGPSGTVEYCKIYANEGRKEGYEILFQHSRFLGRFRNANSSETSFRNTCADRLGNFPDYFDEAPAVAGREFFYFRLPAKPVSGCQIARKILAQRDVNFTYF